MTNLAFCRNTENRLEEDIVEVVLVILRRNDKCLKLKGGRDDKRGEKRGVEGHSGQYRLWELIKELLGEEMTRVFMA